MVSVRFFQGHTKIAPIKIKQRVSTDDNHATEAKRTSGSVKQRHSFQGLVRFTRVSFAGIHSSKRWSSNTVCCFFHGSNDTLIKYF